ncbi:hypothetical protein DVH24_016755 [Malus domestica]|uniref:Retroviral polymerase SH3-like domain-containing protein n=1 Tax=Malus domestica TaxID=3750 RepID=A0A498HYE1_MALDO|nr:hypothetical protein DVH24_016755 [Malus domestica]
MISAIFLAISFVSAILMVMVVYGENVDSDEISGSMPKPVFLDFDFPPPSQDLNIFGSTVYLYLTHYNDNKLQPITFVGLFLGYALGYKCVICHYLQSKKLILSRHVLHDKSIFPAKLLNKCLQRL